MAGDKRDVLVIGPARPVITEGLAPCFDLIKLNEFGREKVVAEHAANVHGFAVTASTERVDSAFMRCFPHLEIVASFGVGYDHVDAVWAGAHGVTVTNTPDVLTEEVADTALGLLLCTVRELPQAERHLRSGKW